MCNMEQRACNIIETMQLSDMFRQLKHAMIDVKEICKGKILLIKRLVLPE